MAHSGPADPAGPSSCPQPAPSSAPVSPVFMALAGVFCGSAMDAVVKSTALAYPLLMLIFWRFLIGTVAVGGVFFLSGRRLGPWRTIRFHIARGFVHAGAVVLFFYGITQLPLVEVTTIGFVAVLMVAPLERLFLKEPLHPKSLLAALCGFAGVAVIALGSEGAAVGGESPWLGRLATVASAAFFALSLIMLRARAKADGVFATAVYSNAMPALWLALPAVLLTGPPPLDGLPLFAGLAAIGTLTWLLLSYAYAHAPAQRLSPLDYSALIWSALLGWIFFGETVSWMFAMGAALVVGACLLVVREERQGR